MLPTFIYFTESECQRQRGYRTVKKHKLGFPTKENFRRKLHNSVEFVCEDARKL